VQVSDVRIPFFIGVGLPVVAVKPEVSIASGIDADLRELLLLTGILDLTAQRKNRAGANKERDGIDWSVGANGLAPSYRLFVQ
jgi:hypothetical protein